MFSYCVCMDLQTEMWNILNRPITQIHKDIQIHRAKMTLEVYSFDEKKFKNELTQALLSRSIFITWVTDRGFFANTSIRDRISNKNDILYGQDRLEIKTMNTLCDEIALCKSPKVEILFHTSSEILGYRDQMLYWRW